MAAHSSKSRNTAIFRTSPCTLQELASMRFALQIWIQKFHKYNQNLQMTVADVGCVRYGLQFELNKLTNVPCKIKTMIESCFDPITTEMTSWYKTSNSILKYTKFGNISCRFDLVVFGGNGTVNVEDTISKLFDDSCIHNVTKFEIACTFCVEEKIDLYWPQVSYILSMEKMRFNTDFMVCYWICRKRGDLDRSPLKDYSDIKRLMIDHCCQWGFFLAAEYFLNSFNPCDRLIEIDRLCETRIGFKCIKYLLPLFQPSVQRHVLDREKIRILNEFIEDYEPIEYVVQMWIYLRDSISSQSYCNDLILRSIRFRNESGFKNDVFRYQYIEIMLAEIWSNSSDELKQYTLNFYFSSVLKHLASFNVNHLSDFSRDISFLLAMLSDASVTLRSSFWVQNWPQWIDGVPPDQFQRLMRLCLVKSEAIEQFSRTFAHTDIFQNYFDRLMSLGYHNELNDFLNILYTDRNQVLEAKKSVLAKGKKVFKSSRDILVTHALYIDYVFSDDALSKDFKHRLIFFSEILKQLCCKIVNNEFSDLQFIVELFVSSQKHEHKIKKQFLKFLRDRIIDGRLSGFNETKWRQFVMWCLNEDEQELADFMNSLPIDHIFENAFASCLVFEPIYWSLEFLYPCKAADLDKFLSWYFKSKSLSENYKRGRIEYYKRMSDEDVERIFGRSKKIVVGLMKKDELSWNKGIMSMHMRLLLSAGSMREIRFGLVDFVQAKCRGLWNAIIRRIRF